MQGCQSSSAGADAVNAAAQFVDSTANTVNRLIALPELAAVDGVRRILANLARSDTADGITAHIHVTLFDGDGIMAVVASDIEGRAVDRRRIDRRRCDAVQSLDVFGQFHGQRIIAVRDDADVAIREGARRTAFDVGRTVQLLLNHIAAVAGKLHAVVRCGYGMTIDSYTFDIRLAINTFRGFCSFDRRFIVTVLKGQRAVLTISCNSFRAILAGHSQLAILAIFALGTDGHVVAQGNVIVGPFLVSCIGLFHDQVALCVATIDGNRGMLLGHLVDFVVHVVNLRIDVLFHLLQLVFRSCLAGGDVFAVPSRIGQAVHRPLAVLVDGHAAGGDAAVLDVQFDLFVALADGHGAVIPVNGDLLVAFPEVHVISQIHSVLRTAILVGPRGHGHIPGRSGFHRAVGRGFLFHLRQLGHIDRIRRSLAISHMGNDMAARINARIGDAGTIRNLQAAAIYNGSGSAAARHVTGISRAVQAR